MKKIILIIYFQIQFLYSFAQLVHVQWNPIRKADQYAEVYNMQTDDSLSTWFLETQGKITYVQGIRTSNPSLVMRYQSQFKAPFVVNDLGVKWNPPAIEDGGPIELTSTAYLFHNHNGGIVLYQKSNGESETSWYSQLFDASGKPNGSPKKLHSYVDYSTLYGNASIYDKQVTASSKNLNFHAVVFIHPSKGGKADSLFAVLFDENFQILKQSKFVFPVLDSHYVPEGLQVNNEGEILLLGGHKLSGKEKRGTDAEVETVPDHVDFTGKLTPVKLGNIPGVTFGRKYFFDDAGTLFFTGLTRLDDKNKTVECFLSKISGKDFSLQSTASTPLPTELSAKLKSSVALDRDIDFLNAIAYKDGAALILYYGDGKYKRYSLVLMMKASGEISSTCAIANFVWMATDQLSQIAAAVVNQKLVIFYNESKDNAVTTDFDKMKVAISINGMIPMVAIINDDGTYKKQKMLTPVSKDEDFLLLADKCGPVDANHYRIVVGDIKGISNVKDLSIGILNL